MTDKKLREEIHDAIGDASDRWERTERVLSIIKRHRQEWALEILGDPEKETHIINGKPEIEWGKVARNNLRAELCARMNQEEKGDN